MATITGNDGVVLIDTNAIAEVTSFTINENADRIEDTALGDANRTYKAGLPDVGGTIECWFDDSDTNGQEALDVGSTVNLVLRPAGTGTGLAEWTVSADILSIETSVSFNEIVQRSFSWGAAGTLTKGTQA
jgi:hypothetical protein